MSSPRPAREGDGARTPPDLGEPERVTRVVFGCRPEDVAEDVVVTPFLPLKGFRLQAESLDCELSPPFFYKGFTLRRNGRPLTVLHTGVGPSRVGDCLGFLALTPARRVLFAGAVGGLAPEHRVGDYFVPTAAADGEGYTRYADNPFAVVVASARLVEPPPEATVAATRFLESEGIAPRAGSVFTIGSITFESLANLEAIAAAGFQALEMELSAFFAAARRHGLAPLALTYISDLPLRSSLWQEKSPEETLALRHAYRELPRLALDCLARC